MIGLTIASVALALGGAGIELANRHIEEKKMEEAVKKEVKDQMNNQNDEES